MRELIRYAMLTVGFRYGSYAAASTLFAAILLLAFGFNPLGQFRLMLAMITLIVTILAMRNYKLIYNGGQLSLTHGAVVAFTVAIVNSLLYSIVILIWATLSTKLWQLHIADQYNDLEKGTWIFHRFYSEETIEIIRANIPMQTPKSVALIAFYLRLAWNFICGLLVSLYFRK